MARKRQPAIPPDETFMVETALGQHAIVPYWLIEDGISANGIALMVFLQATCSGRVIPPADEIARRLRLTAQEVKQAFDELVRVGVLVAETTGNEVAYSFHLTHPKYRN